MNIDTKSSDIRFETKATRERFRSTYRLCPNIENMAVEVCGLSPDHRDVRDSCVGEGGKHRVAEPGWWGEDCTRACPHHPMRHTARVHGASL